MVASQKFFNLTEELAVMVGLGKPGSHDGARQFATERAENNDWGIGAGRRMRELARRLRPASAGVVCLFDVVGIEDDQVRRVVPHGVDAPPDATRLDRLGALPLEQRPQYLSGIRRTVDDQHARSHKQEGNGERREAELVGKSRAGWEK